MWSTAGGPSPTAAGRVPLTSWEIATRLSLFLWNTSPDPLLLDAAERDELADPAGLRRHVHRLLASPRAKEGLRNFFAELYRMDALDSVRRDKDKLPATSVRAIGRTMKEETMLVLEHNIFTERADFRKLFTTRDTFLNRDMAVLYGARVVDGGMFTKIMLAADSPRRGLLGHASFLAGTSAPDKTSPTIRGKYVREILLCEPVPAPPPDVDTNLPPAEGAHQTTARAAGGAPPGFRLRQVPQADRSHRTGVRALRPLRRVPGAGARPGRSIPAAIWTASPSPTRLRWASC